MKEQMERLAQKKKEDSKMANSFKHDHKNMKKLLKKQRNADVKMKIVPKQQSQLNAQLCWSKTSQKSDFEFKKGFLNRYGNRTQNHKEYLFYKTEF